MQRTDESRLTGAVFVLTWQKRNWPASLLLAFLIYFYLTGLKNSGTWELLLTKIQRSFLLRPRKYFLIWDTSKLTE